MNSRTLPVFAALLAAVLPLPAEEIEPKSAGPAVAAAPLRSDQELDELLGPVALYPDALVAVILPAATRSTEIVLAARYLRDGGSADRLDEQPWDESVRALAHHPDVVKWMDNNLAWTAQVGEAFLAQPAEVMKSIQRLRAKARAVGSLTDTPQQKVLVEETETIRIVPADPEIIYVPRYDPEIVFIERRTYYPDPFITFGFGYTVGSWLSYDCDWRYWRLHVIDRGWNWRSQPSWCHQRFYHGPVFQPAYWRPWTPPRVHVRHDYTPDRHRPRPAPVRPTRFVDNDRSRPPHLDNRRPDVDRRPGRDSRPDYDRPGRRPGSGSTDLTAVNDRPRSVPATRHGELTAASTLSFAGAPVIPPVATPVVPPVSSESFVPPANLAGRSDSGRRGGRPVEVSSRPDYRGDNRTRDHDGSQRFGGTRHAPAAPYSPPAVSTPSVPARAPVASTTRYQGDGPRRGGDSGSAVVSTPSYRPRTESSGSQSYRPRSEPSSSSGGRSRQESSGDSSSRGERYQRFNQDR